MNTRTLIINSEKVNQKITRIAYEILENNFEEEELILVGISKRGYQFAEKVYESLQKIDPKLKTSLFSISLDKDNVFDLEKIKFSGDLNLLTNKTVIVIDDVLNSGKTLMYAVRHLLGTNINKLNTALLVDRRHRNFPIRADFAGLTLSTTLKEHISVIFEENEVNVFLD